MTWATCTPSNGPRDHTVSVAASRKRDVPGSLCRSRFRVHARPPRETGIRAVSSNAQARASTFTAPACGRQAHRFSVASGIKVRAGVRTGPGPCPGRLLASGRQSACQPWAGPWIFIRSDVRHPLPCAHELECVFPRGGVSRCFPFVKYWAGAVKY